MFLLFTFNTCHRDMRGDAVGDDCGLEAVRGVSGVRTPNVLQTRKSREQRASSSSRGPSKSPREGHGELG